jgi:transposase
MSQRRFAQEFEDEAIRLALTSGRTQREIAGDLGIGLSTLVRWNGRSRDRQAKAFGRQTEPDIAAKLKRLGRSRLPRQFPRRPAAAPCGAAAPPSSCPRWCGSARAPLGHRVGLGASAGWSAIICPVGPGYRPVERHLRLRGVCGARRVADRAGEVVEPDNDQGLAGRMSLSSSRCGSVLSSSVETRA